MNYKPFANAAKKMLLVFLAVVSFRSFSQSASENVGIGTTSPDPSAILELQSTNKGFLLPRLTLRQRVAIPKPAIGLMVYQTDFLQGIYIFDGGNWSIVGHETTTSELTSWKVEGNSQMSENNFIGTSDIAALRFRVNNEPSGIIEPRLHNTFLGYRAGIFTKSLNSVVLGAYALQQVSEGSDNVVVGYHSMYSHQNGNFNVAVGSTTLAINTEGSRNTILGAMAGYRATGSGNVLLGFQAGYFESGDNKLYIHNSPSANPLIYGDFDKRQVGINTSNPSSTLTINSNDANKSGLQFLNLTSNSPITETSSKVLSVDNVGNVILVENAVGAGSEVPSDSTASNVKSFWIESGKDIKNVNQGKVLVSNDLTVAERINVKRVEVGSGGIVFKELTSAVKPLSSNGKVLTVDASGNMILVNDAVGNTTASPSYWKLTKDRLDLAQTSKVVIGEGITKLSDNFNLYVSKGILAERVRVAVPNSDKWADYVFNEKYVLKPLSQVEAYVNKFHHLPNMPSDKEMVDGGLDVLEMNAKLLEKVEELTLYAIEANKRIEALEKRLEKLEQK